MRGLRAGGVVLVAVVFSVIPIVGGSAGVIWLRRTDSPPAARRPWVSLTLWPGGLTGIVALGVFLILLGHRSVTCSTGPVFIPSRVPFPKPVCTDSTQGIVLPDPLLALVWAVAIAAPVMAWWWPRRRRSLSHAA